jgi:hypothetical protein
MARLLSRTSRLYWRLHSEHNSARSVAKSFPKITFEWCSSVICVDRNFREVPIVVVYLYNPYNVNLCLGDLFCIVMTVSSDLPLTIGN